MAIPEIKVEFDVTNSPSSTTRSWTDVTAYGGINRVRAASWIRDGRTKETERTQAGSLQSLVLDNSDGLFDRLNTSGAFYGALDKAFWIRIGVTWNSVYYPRWVGIKNKVDGFRPAGGRDRYVEIAGDSPRKLLELYPLAGQSLPAESTSARITRLLNLVGVSVGTIAPTDLGSFVEDAQAFAATDTASVGSHLDQVEGDERGLLFVDSGGLFQFQAAKYRAEQIDAGVSATIGETAGDLRYADADTMDEAEFIFTQVAVTPLTGAIQVAESSVGETDNFLRRLDLSSASSDTAQALSNAQWFAYKFSAPLAWLPQLEIVGARDSTTWPTILAAKNSDYFNWMGAGKTVGCLLERVTESWLPGQPLKVLWELSPSDREAIWSLDVSELDVSTRTG